MSKLLEIFGKAIKVDTAELIWHWLNTAQYQGQTNSPEQSEELNQAIELLGNLKADQAAEKLKFYLFEHPDCARGRMAAAAICICKNDPAGAIEQANSIYMRQPSLTIALYTLGYCFERLGKEAEAIEFYQDCVKFKSHLQLPRQRMAAIYFKNGRLDKTISEYELLTTEHPEDVSSQTLLGYLYIADGQYDKAIETFNMAIISHPDNFHDDQTDELEQLVDADQFDRALEHVDWLMEQLGNLPDLYVKKADILNKAGRTSQAAVNYENAIRWQPNYLEAAIKLGTCHLRLGHYCLAAEHFNRAVEINDEVVDTYIGLSTAQHLNGQDEESVRTLSLASAIQQNSTLLFSETATLNLQTMLAGQDTGGCQSDSGVLLSDVVRAHEKLLEEKPYSADAHYKFGILMMVSGRPEDAIKCFGRALEINPTHHRARSKMAICLFDMGRTEPAIDNLVGAETPDLSLLKLHYRTAILFCDRHKFTQAVSALENSLNDNNSESGSETTANIELVLENLGLVDRALARWDRLTETAHQAMVMRNQ